MGKHVRAVVPGNAGGLSSEDAATDEDQGQNIKTAHKENGDYLQSLLVIGRGHQFSDCRARGSISGQGGEG